MRNAAGIGIALLIIFSAGVARSGERLLSPDRFAKRFVTELLSRAPEAKVVVHDGSTLRVEAPSRPERITIFLDNAYRSYELRPEHLEEIIAGQVSATLEPMTSSGGDLDPSRIVPLIKDAAYLEEIVSGAEARGFEGPKRALAVDRYNADLVVLYAEDRDLSVRYLSEEELRGIELPREAVRRKAIDNLRSILPPVEVHGEGGSYLITAGGTFETSLLLFDELWRSDELAVNGDLVVSIPARDVLLVTGSNDAEGLEKIAKMASEVAASAPHRLTEQLFVYRGGRFVRFER